MIRKILNSIYFYPVVALLFIFLGVLGVYEYTIVKSKENIVRYHIQEMKEEALLLKSLVEELSQDMDQSLIQKEILRFSMRKNLKHIILLSKKEIILYSNNTKNKGKQFREIVPSDMSQHYEKDKNGQKNLYIHKYPTNKLDITIKIDHLYIPIQNQIGTGYLTLLYDLDDISKETENNIKQELSYVFILICALVFILFYLYYQNILTKLQLIEEISLSFTKSKTLSHYSSIDNILNQLKQTTIDFQLISKVMRYSNDAIIITDNKKHILSVNPTFEDITGYKENDILGKSPEEILKSDLMSEEYYKKMWYDLQKNGKFQGQIINRKKDGTTYTAWQKIWSIKDTKTNEVVNYVSMSQDISELIKKQKEIEDLAYYDGLTKLVNRSYFLHLVNKLIKKRSKDNFALIFANLDNFKEVNDTVGHHAGDIVLQKFANFLNNTLYNEDIIARLGGDEFAILAYNITEPENAFEVGCKIVNFSKQELFIDNKKIDIGVSIGISMYPNDGNEPEKLLAASETAMYRSKKEGKNQCTLFQENMQEEAIKKIHIKHQLTEAIKNNEFELFYQPKFTADGTKIVSFEALIRWNHPKKGFIQPDEFIPIAEESGIIVEITKWIFQDINTTYEEFSEIYDDFSIAINISAKHFKDNKLIHQIKSLIDEKWIKNEYLELEVTESAVMHDIENTKKQLLAIKKMGIKISLDDYGTGHSSLAYLKDLPIDNIKVDKSFVDGICNNKKDYAIVKSTIALAESLNMHTIIEGVEDIEQVKLVQEFGATYIQGYVYSKPLNKADTIKLLQSIV